MNWSAALLNAGECIEREWIGVSRPHPARLLDGDSRRTRPPFVPDALGVAYCPRCGGSTGPGEYIEATGCGACRNRRHPWDRLLRLGRHHGDLREWVHEIKFQAWDAMGMELGKRLGRCLRDAGVQADAVVPVPASAWRRWRRGIDHSRIIAAGAASVLGLPLARAMKRQGRKPQRAVSPSQRRENIRGAFSVKRMNFLRDCNVVLVDDVTTTRATLTEACRTLQRQAGVGSITCAVLTVAEPGRDGPAQPAADLF